MSQIEVKNSPCLDREWLQRKRFTDNAQRMLRHARERALERGMLGVLPPSLLLLSMLKCERKIGIIVLEQCGVNLKELERDVEAELELLRSSGERQVLDFGKICEVAVFACEEAKGFGKDWVGTEHFILAFCRVEDRVVNKLFKKHGIAPEVYRPKYLELLYNA